MPTVVGFNFYIALDGHGLNGFEGFAGVARLACEPERDSWEPEVRFFDGIAGGHAVQLSPQGTVGFLGNLSQQLEFFDPRTLRALARTSTLAHRAPKLFYESQTRDVCYVPTQRCIPQDGDFTEYAIAHFKNYLFEIDVEGARVARHLAIPKDLPGALTSDVVVTEEEVIYNVCAAGVLARGKLADFAHVTWIDERPGPREQLRAWRAGVGNLVEILSRVNLPSATHWFVKALRVAGGSAVDGSYGLGLSPDRRWLLSAHRGPIEVLVYDYPSLEIHRRIAFPPMRAFYKHLGRRADTRLGFHHAVLRCRAYRRSRTHRRFAVWRPGCGARRAIRRSTGRWMSTRRRRSHSSRSRPSASRSRTSSLAPSRSRSAISPSSTRRSGSGAGSSSASRSICSSPLPPAVISPARASTRPTRSACRSTPARSASAPGASATATTPTPRARA